MTLYFLNDWEESQDLCPYQEQKQPLCQCKNAAHPMHFVQNANLAICAKESCPLEIQKPVDIPQPLQ